jgi:hypothetical protein
MPVAAFRHENIEVVFQVGADVRWDDQMTSSGFSSSSCSRSCALISLQLGVCVPA